MLITSTCSSVQHVGPGDHAADVPLDPQHAGLVAVALDHQRLDVEHDVGHVLDDAGQRGELVLGAVELDPGDRAPLQARQEDPAEAVADRHAEAALERLGNELAVRRGQRRPVADHLTGKLKSPPSNTHGISLRESI